MAGSFVRSVVNRIEVPVEDLYVVHHTLLKPAQSSEPLEPQTPTALANHGGSNDNPVFMHWLPNPALSRITLVAAYANALVA